MDLGDHPDEAEAQHLLAALESLAGTHVFIYAEVQAPDGISAREAVRPLAQRVATGLGAAEPPEISEPYAASGDRIGIAASIGPVGPGPEPALAAAVNALADHRWHRPRFHEDGSSYVDRISPAAGSDGITEMRIVAGRGIG
jgi:hypothetical protein